MIFSLKCATLHALHAHAFTILDLISALYKAFENSVDPDQLASLMKPADLDLHNRFIRS